MNAHIVYCPFTGLGAKGGYRGDRWLKRRIDIFLRYVVPSLMYQTRREFVLWVSWRPEEEGNPMVKELKRTLDGLAGFTSVFTYHGCCFYDDKYDDITARERMMDALSKSLPLIAPHVAEAEWVYLTVQPSDDLYAMDAFERIMAVEPRRKRACGWRNGWVTDYCSGRVAEYDPDTVPPFTTVIFPRDKFVDARRHFSYLGPYRSHEYVPDHMDDCVWLEGRGYMVGTHGANISTTWTIPYRRREIHGKEREAVRIHFNQHFREPLPREVTARLLLRDAFNSLPRPFQSLVKNAYNLIIKLCR